jgi:[NiFe] hydrogenase assembly HybE family chaperone
MTTDALPDPSARLERAFGAVAERMCDLPFYNPALRVEAVGFAPWELHWLGVLVTPWAINLMLLPLDAGSWLAVDPGAKRRYAFPAGHYDFIDGRDPQAGDYRMCSLFSPALEFEDHDSAVMVAKLARAALLDAAHAEPVEAGPLTRLEAQAQAPLSKRDFLRGRFLADPNVPRG